MYGMEEFAAYSLNEKNEWELAPCHWPKESKKTCPIFPSLSELVFKEREIVILPIVVGGVNKDKKCVVQGVMITFRFDKDTTWNIYYDLKWESVGHTHGYFTKDKIQKG